MNSYPYDNAGGNYPGPDSPPPQYSPPSRAHPGSNHHYPSPSDVSPTSPYALSQPLAAYHNSQAIPSPARLNHGHYASAPSYYPTFHDLRASHTGPHQAYGDPHASDSGSYGACGDPYSNKGPYQAYSDPHAAGGSYQAHRATHAPNTGSYQAYNYPHASDTGQYPVYRGPYASDSGYPIFHSPHASETRPYVRHQSFPSSSPPANSAYVSPSDVGLHSGASQPPEYGHKWHPRSSPSQPSPDYRPPEYSSSQAPEKQRYHSPSDAGRDAGTLTAKKSAARTRGGDARADASNAITVSDFVSEHLLLRCRAPTNLIPTLYRRWFVIFVVEVIASQGISFRIKLFVSKSLPTLGSWGSLLASPIFAPR